MKHLYNIDITLKCQAIQIQEMHNFSNIKIKVFEKLNFRCIIWELNSLSKNIYYESKYHENLDEIIKSKKK